MKVFIALFALAAFVCVNVIFLMKTLIFANDKNFLGIDC